MSKQKDLLREIAAAIAHPDHPIERWFTEDFRLHDPTAPGWPSGHSGAAAMLKKTASGGRTTRLEALDMVEEGDRVAVRWRLSATPDVEHFEFSIMALYRFENGRIAEDWGIAFRGEWS